MGKPETKGQTIIPSLISLKRPCVWPATLTGQPDTRPLLDSGYTIAFLCDHTVPRRSTLAYGRP